MNKENIKEILYVVITIILAVLAVKFVIWLLPVILVVIFGLFIYKSIKRSKWESEINKSKKEKNIKEIFDYKEK